MIFASSGPSPLIPLLLVGALSWMIYGEALAEWYEYATELQETVTESWILILAAAVVGLLLLNYTAQLIVLPFAAIVVVLMLQNTLITALVLLLVLYFLGAYYHSPVKSAPYSCWEGGATPTSIPGGGDQGFGFGSGFGFGFGLGFYILVLLCLILCALFCEEGEGWWLSFVCVVACVIFFYVFSHSGL